MGTDDLDPVSQSKTQVKTKAFNWHVKWRTILWDRAFKLCNLMLSQGR